MELFGVGQDWFAGHGERNTGVRACEGLVVRRAREPMLGTRGLKYGARGLKHGERGWIPGARGWLGVRSGCARAVLSACTSACTAGRETERVGVPAREPLQQRSVTRPTGACTRVMRADEKHGTRPSNPGWRVGEDKP